MSVALTLACPHCGHEVLEEAQFCHLCGVVLKAQSNDVVPPLLKMELGSLWRRFLACGVDVAVVLAMFAPSVAVLVIILGMLVDRKILETDEAGKFAGTAGVIFFVVADWVYNARMNSSSQQATLGKRWMGLKVTNLSGERIPFSQATGRYFAKYLSTFALFVGFILPLFSKRRQALHDMVAGTLVLKSK